jgi:mRNA interferase MazF
MPTRSRGCNATAVAREIWWADLEEPRGSEPGYRRPVLVVQADAFNRSELKTVAAVVLTSNTRLLDAPGNVLRPAKSTSLEKDSVANVTQIVTLDEDCLTEKVRRISSSLMARVDAGLKLVLDL